MCVCKSMCVHTVELDRYDRLTSTCYWEESVQPSVNRHNTSCLEPPKQPCDQATGQPEIIETGKRAMRGHTDGGGAGRRTATCDRGWWGRWWRDEGEREKKKGKVKSGEESRGDNDVGAGGSIKVHRTEDKRDGR